MLNLTLIKTSTFIGESKIRASILAIGGALFAVCFFREKIPYYTDILTAFHSRSEAFFSSAFTFLSVFWAAMLTIWSLLKSRATRYIERISDNIIFKDYVRVFETRLIMSLFTILISFAMYIVNPSFTNDVSVFILAVWFFLYSATLLLLVDCLLSARIVLD